MRVQLVIPPFPRDARLGKTRALYPVYPQLGIAYVAAEAERRGHKVSIIEAEVLLLDEEDTLELIEDFRPDVLGFQVFTHSQDTCHEIARMAKEKLPDVTVVVGGIASTAQPDYQLRPESPVDYAVRGEGEQAFGELLEVLEGRHEMTAEQLDQRLSQVMSVSYRGLDGAPRHNPRRPEVTNMDDLPFPAFHLLPMHAYTAPAQLRGTAIHEMMLTRGCPYNCSFCMSPQSYKKRFRSFSVERTMTDIGIMRERYGMDSIQFYDDVFTYDREKCMELLDAMIDSGMNLPWTCLTRVDLVDQELLNKMAQAGCYQIFYGMENASQRILDLVHKGIKSLDQIRDAVAMTRKAGIESFLSVMLGFPTETKEEAYETMRFVRSVDPDYALWHRFTPWPGSAIYDLALEHGKLQTDDLSKYTINWGFVYLPDGWTHAELEKAERTAMRRFYLRPSKLLGKFKLLWRLPRERAWRLLKHGPDLLRTNPNAQSQNAAAGAGA